MADITQIKQAIVRLSFTELLSFLKIFSISKIRIKTSISVRILMVFCFILYFTAFSSKSYASDYLVDFISENYKELYSDKEIATKIYHTIQVETEELGSKLLMLVGDDLDYRIWLRQYLATAKQLIITVPDDQNPLFKDSKMFQIDVKLIHPLANNNWKKIDPVVIGEPEVKPPYKGKKHILIVEDNQKKRNLIQMVIKKLGFPTTTASNSYDALNIFKNQPDKYNLIIAGSNNQNGVSTTSLVRNILDTSPDISIILGTDYKDEKANSMLTDFFAGFSRVIIKPLVLQELSKTILQIVDNKA